MEFTNTLDFIIDNLKLHKQLIESETYYIQDESFQHDRLRALQRVSDKVLKHGTDRVQLRRDFETKEEQRKVDQQLQTLKWISASDMTEIDHRSFQEIRNRNPYSGRWLLGQDKMENWLYADDTPPTHSLLWIHGTKGAGGYAY